MVHSLRPASPLRRCSGPAGQQGFTLIELLVVVIILGVLAAIALPSFLNQVAKSKQAQALKYIGVVNRAQQAYFLEHTSFATSLEDLGFEAQSTPTHYTVTFEPQGMMISTKATPTSTDLRGYAGVVFTTVDSGGSIQLDTLICEGGLAAPPEPTLAEVGGQTKVTNCNTF